MSRTVDEHARLVRDRTEIMRLLGSPQDPRTIRDETGSSRATVTRALRELEEAGFVTQREGGYRLTAAGRLALTHYERRRAERADLVEAQSVTAQLPDDAALDPAVVIGATVTTPSTELPYVPDDRIQEMLTAADRYRAALSAFENPRHLRLLYEHVVTDGALAEFVVPSPVFDALRERFPRRLAAMAETETFDIFVGEPPEYGLIVTDETCALVVPGENGGLVRNDRDAALAWAGDRYETVRETASRATDRLRQTDEPVVGSRDRET